MRRRLRSPEACPLLRHLRSNSCRPVCSLCSSSAIPHCAGVSALALLSSRHGRHGDARTMPRRRFRCAPDETIRLAAATHQMQLAHTREYEREAIDAAATKAPAECRRTGGRQQAPPSSESSDADGPMVRGQSEMNQMDSHNCTTAQRSATGTQLQAPLSHSERHFRPSFGRTAH